MDRFEVQQCVESSELHDYKITYKNVSKTIPTKVSLSISINGTSIMTDQVDLGKEAKRIQFIDSLIAKHSGLVSKKDNIRQQLLQIANELIATDEPEDGMQSIETPLEQSEKALAETDPELTEVALNFLKKPELVELILKHIELMGVVNERPLALALYLIFTSRLLANPLAGCVVGTSSSGKSYAVKMVARLFPDEAVLQAHRITPAALQYLPKGSLVHRAVITGERNRKIDDEQAEATRALREMISDGVLRTAVTSKDANGRLETQHVIQPGPIAYVESTTLGSGEIFDEDRTRFLFLCVDESEPQSKAVLHRLAADAMAPQQNEDIESLIALHHTVQRLLTVHDVIIPFAADLITAIPCRRPESRRAFGHLLNLIKASAILHQYQRKTDVSGLIVADVVDYDIVRTFLSDAIGRGLGVVLSAGAEGLIEIIEDTYKLGDTFTAADLKELTGLGRVVYDRLKELRHHGYLKMEAGSGNVAAKYERNPLPGGAEGLELPRLENNEYDLPSAIVHTNSQGVL